MRRREKEIKDKVDIESILQRATVCRVALCDNGVPYVVPLSFGYLDDRLYFHSAPVGKKIDIIKHNNNVCFEVDIDRAVVEAEVPCQWSAKYRSVIGLGKAHLVEDPDEKRRALEIIVSHYSAGSYEYPHEAINSVAIFRVDIESMTGKQSGY